MGGMSGRSADMLFESRRVPHSSRSEGWGTDESPRVLRPPPMLRMNGAPYQSKCDTAPVHRIQWNVPPRWAWTSAELRTVSMSLKTKSVPLPPLICQVFGSTVV